MKGALGRCTANLISPVKRAVLTFSLLGNLWLPDYYVTCDPWCISKKDNKWFHLHIPQEQNDPWPQMVFKQQRSFGPPPPPPSNHDKYPPPPKSHDILKLSTPLTVFKSSTEQSTKLQSSDQKQDFQIKFEV